MALYIHKMLCLDYMNHQPFNHNYLLDMPFYASLDT